jgi:hypothetical protein
VTQSLSAKQLTVHCCGKGSRHCDSRPFDPFQSRPKQWPSFQI